MSARSGPPQHGPANAADAASRDLVAVGAALTPHAAVPAFLGGLRRGVELVSGIRQIRARRRRQQWWGAAMEADAPLDFALFQLSPRQR